MPAPKPLDQPKPHRSKPEIGTSGSQWCITYSPYNADGTCKSSSSVASDVKSIAAKGFSSIRLYSTDCSGLENVGNVAKANGLKLVLGVFISNSGIADAKAQVDEIISWAGGSWDCVEMIVVGNEAVFNGYCTASALADFILSAKSMFAKAGYTGPVTTTEPLNIISENAHLLCHVVDVAAANIHPYFNAAVTADEAGEFVAKELALLESLCPGLAVYNLETGWPSAGLPNGAAIPGPSEQAAAIESIKKIAGGNCAFFSFVDELFKVKGQLEVWVLSPSLLISSADLRAQGAKLGVQSSFRMRRAVREGSDGRMKSFPAAVVYTIRKESQRPLHATVSSQRTVAYSSSLRLLQRRFSLSSLCSRCPSAGSTCVSGSWFPFSNLFPQFYPQAVSTRFIIPSEGRIGSVSWSCEQPW